MKFKFLFYRRAILPTTLLLFFLTFLTNTNANTTNSIPYADDFESYTNGTYLANSGGWYANEIDALQVITTNMPYTGQKPLVTTHTNILHLTSSVTNQFAISTNIWVDMLIMPRRWEETNRPAIPTNSQVAIYFNSNGYINTYCTFWDFAPDTTNLWIEFSDNFIPSNKWLRLTVAIKHNVNTWGEDYFQIRLNNSTELTNYYGQTVAGLYDTGGSWFLCGKRDIGHSKSITFNGDFYTDDLVITNAAPVMTPPRNIRVIAETGSSITPPGPDEAIEDNTSIEFIITNQVGYTITNVAWGVGEGSVYATNYLGPTNSHWFLNVQTNYTIRAFASWTLATNVGAMGTPGSWFQRYGMTSYTNLDTAEIDDSDSDTKLNWEEYVTGTIPTNPASVFQIISNRYTAGSNMVIWIGTTNSGVYVPFDVYRSTNILNGWDASPFASNISRSADGTNVLWDTNLPPSSVPVFYKPLVVWTNY